MAATTLSTPSNTGAKMRWKEPYVSDGLNKKLNGIIPSGIVRGGLLSTAASAFLVDIAPDAGLGDSIYSSIDADGQQITFRQAGTIQLDLAALAGAGRHYICLYVDYTISVDTAIEWRAYPEVDITGTPVAEAPYLVIVGLVDVPGGGPIPAANVLPLGRRDAWASVSKGLTPGVQVVENGSWDFAAETTVSGVTTSNIVGWDESGLSSANYTWRIVATGPRTGAHELEVLGDGVSTEIGQVLGGRYAAVRPGDSVRVRYYIRGAAWGGIGASGHQGVRLGFTDKDKQNLVNVYVDNVGLSGTFAYTLVDEVVEVPAGCAYFFYGVVVDTDGGTPAGSVFFDDIGIWIDGGAALGEDPRRRMAADTGAFSSVAFAPFATSNPTIADEINDTLKLENTSNGAVLGTIVAEFMGAAAKDFDFDAVGMGIKLDRAIKNLGGNLISSAAEAVTARVEGKAAISATSLYTKIAEWGSSGGLWPVRLWFGTGSGGNRSVYAVSINADFDGTIWSQDDATDRSMLFIVGPGGLNQQTKASGTPTWGASSWDPLWDSANNLFSSGVVSTFEDGILEIASPVTSAFGSNIIVGTAPAANSIYAANIVKAWGHFFSSAVSPTIDDGYNFNTCVYSGGDIDVTYHVAMSGPLAQAPQAQISGTAAGAEKEFVEVFNKTINGFSVRLVRESLSVGGDANTKFVTFSLVSSSHEIGFVVCGRQG